jgi:hypothetical protein
MVWVDELGRIDWTPCTTSFFSKSLALLMERGKTSRNPAPLDGNNG